MTEMISPATSVQQQKLKQQLKKKRTGIRAINQGTMYDIPGILTQISRDVRARGGEITDCCVVLRTRGSKVEAYHIGTSPRETASFMLETASASIVESTRYSEKYRGRL